MVKVIVKIIQETDQNFDHFAGWFFGVEDSFDFEIDTPVGKDDKHQTACSYDCSTDWPIVDIGG